ncbi:hypothetical protein Zm00014a_036359 [Zea mays]|uniref:DUF8003 domain-containing protein n=3 Tax=Zea mays TaxID=4577 RepID=A0A8J8YDI8_MAIZE|nr:hypothetical protein ZEAMMB73_Zm00001d008789 [Zea mays]PWZ10738.1 hypothetical protein Zm00014a_036359 [Zea mays]
MQLHHQTAGEKRSKIRRGKIAKPKSIPNPARNARPPPPSPAASHYKRGVRNLYCTTNPNSLDSDEPQFMACHLSPLFNLRLLLLLGAVLGNAVLVRAGGAEASDRAEPDPYSILTWHDYSPPSPPLPPPDPASSTATCEGDLHGKGDFRTHCEVFEEVELGDDIYITGNGSLVLLSGASLTCEKVGCVISANLSGEVHLSRGVRVRAGRVSLVATNITVADTVVVNTTALAGAPPDRTSGVPTGTHGDGGGHGGRGASCFVKEGQTQEDSWGGDAYAWSDLEHPWSYGSKGGSTSVEKDYGGAGGGIVWLFADDLVMNGTVLADGGDSNEKGGGGSGGSIFIRAASMYGGGKISASGGDGLAGGGGGRVSINVFSRHDDTQIFVHGGRSSGCPDNAGAAGTLYEAVPKSLIVSNNNLSTQTDTLLLEFPNQPLWTNVFVRNRAKVAVPLLWSRVQVQGQLSLLSGAILTFGLTGYPYSEFELMAEELLMSDSIIKVFGALRMSVKMLLMWNSRMEIDGGGDSIVATSLLDASNLIVLKESSVIHSNANLGVRGQGVLNLSGDGDTIEAQRLILSLFYSIQVGPGSVLRGPLVNRSSDDVAPKLNCEADSCPVEIIHPPEDCNLNSSLSFTLQVCRVEDIDVWGVVQGTVIHFNRARSVTVHTSGTISATGFGKMLRSGVCGGGGHGGKGGNGFYKGDLAEGGAIYGNADLPCELGSGSGNDSTELSTAGGGIIVMGSWDYSLPSLALYGSVESNGGSYASGSVGGPGGGSGGTILLFVHTLSLAESSVLSSVGGFGSTGSGGGGGGRIHFHWSNIPTGDEYVPVAAVKGSILTRSGLWRSQQRVRIFRWQWNGHRKSLPKGSLWYILQGGAAETPCPYRCVSDRYRMPHCYTALEELIYTFGGPWLFGLFLSGLLILLALVLSVARMKFVGTDELPGPAPTHQGSQIDHSFPFLESLNEVIETNRAEESQGHVHRMYFMGPNTFSEPWHLPHSPPEQITEIVYEDAFNRFVDEINTLAAYQWWEGSIYSILCILAYPLAWSWQQWRRRKKLQRLREFVRSEYDHSCLKSCRSRALYEGLKVTATPDLMLGYLDFFLGGDEKRPDLPPRLRQRFPMSLIFGGDGSYMAPFSLNSDSVLTSLMSQAVPSWIWHRLVAGLNAQLRLVRGGNLKVTFLPVINWLESHANPSLAENGIRVDLAWFQATALGYCQLGLLVYAVEGEAALTEPDGSPRVKIEQHTPTQNMLADTQLSQSRIKDALMRKRITGGVLNSNSLRTLKDRRDLFYPFSHILHNSKPVGHQDLVGLVISILLLADFSLVLLTFLQLYSYSMVDVLLVLFILPLGILSPFPAGINALFSHGPRRSAGLARVYALWNITSLVNVVVAFICGFVHYKLSTKTHPSVQPWNLGTDESGWWLFPTGLMLLKCIQARLVDWHVANLEIQDRAVYSNDPNIFWQS